MSFRGIRSLTVAFRSGAPASLAGPVLRRVIAVLLFGCWTGAYELHGVGPTNTTCLRFDGSDDFVQITHAPDLNPFPFTVTAWIKTRRNELIVDGIVSKYVE